MVCDEAQSTMGCVIVQYCNTLWLFHNPAAWRKAGAADLRILLGSAESALDQLGGFFGIDIGL
jgi:hypothetical protein